MLNLVRVCIPQLHHPKTPLAMASCSPRRSQVAPWYCPGCQLCVKYTVLVQVCHPNSMLKLISRFSKNIKTTFSRMSRSLRSCACIYCDNLYIYMYIYILYIYAYTIFTPCMGEIYNEATKPGSLIQAKISLVLSESASAIVQPWWHTAMEDGRGFVVCSRSSVFRNPPTDLRPQSDSLQETLQRSWQRWKVIC